MSRKAADRPPGTRASPSARKPWPCSSGRYARRTMRFRTARHTPDNDALCFHKPVWKPRLRPTHPRNRLLNAKRDPKDSKILCCDPFLSPYPDRGSGRPIPSGTMVICQSHKRRQQVWRTKPTKKRPQQLRLHVTTGRHSACHTSGLSALMEVNHSTAGAWFLLKFRTEEAGLASN